jgi:azurin
VTGYGWYTEDIYLVNDQVQIMTRTAQLSKEKRQSIITLRHEGQSMGKI